MNIPGANVLNIALSVLAPQSLQHRAFLSRSVNAVGDFVGVYAAPAAILGSLQPIDRKLYQQLGLNLAKNYVTLYTSAGVQPTGRDREGDLVTFAGKTYRAESDQSWFDVDGFTKLICVEVGDDE